MKIALLTAGAGNSTAIKFLDSLQRNNVQVGLVIVEREAKKTSRWQRAKRYFHPGYAFYLLYVYLFCSRALRSAPPWQEVAKVKCPTSELIYVENMNDQVVAERLAAYDADLLVVVGTRILKPAVFRSAKLALNYHSGILPAFKGSYTVFWAMYEGDYSKLGYSFHEVVTELDAGRVIKAKGLTPLPCDYERSVFEQLEDDACDALLQLVEDYRNGSLQFEPRQAGSSGRLFRGRPPGGRWFILALKLITRRLLDKAWGQNRC